MTVNLPTTRAQQRRGSASGGVAKYHSLGVCVCQVMLFSVCV